MKEERFLPYWLVKLSGIILVIFAIIMLFLSGDGVLVMFFPMAFLIISGITLFIKGLKEKTSRRIDTAVKMSWIFVFIWIITGLIGFMLTDRSAMLGLALIIIPISLFLIISITIFSIWG